MSREGTVGFMVAAFAGVVLMIVLFFSYSTSGPTVVLESDNGGSVTIDAGETLEVVLGGNITTGYTWYTVDVDPAVLTEVGDPVFDPESDLLGSPGTITLTFEGVAEGTTQLVLEYRRANDTAPVNTFTISVTVK